jgi:hypothetical protein
MEWNLLDLLAVSTPGINPISGEYFLYMKNDGNLYSLNSAGSEQLISGGGGAVASVFGRTGAVAALGSDYSAFYLQKSNNLSDLSNASTARTNLGLGTAATQPSSAFDAAGSASAAQTAAEAASIPISGGNSTGTINVAGNVGIRTTSPVAPLDVEAVATATSGTNYGIKDLYSINPSSSSSAEYEGLGNITATPLGNTQNMYLLKSGYHELDHNGEGTVTYATAVGGAVFNAQQGTIQNAFGAYLGVYNNNDGIINTGYGAFVDTPYDAGSGTMGTWYGLYVHGDSYASTSYGVYSTGGINYFGGNVGIGTSTPSSALQVSGTATATNVTVSGLLNLPVQASGTTPSGAVNGSVAFTSLHVLCVYTGTSWVQVANGSTTCTF